MRLLRRQLAPLEKVRLPGGPEAAVQGVMPYLLGWTDSVVRTAPDLMDELAGEIETTMCDHEASPASIMLMSRVVQQLPELGNPRGFDCVVARGTEDVVLWDALDAWRKGALPKSAALERLERAATDERTRRRSIKWDDELAHAEPLPPLDEEAVEQNPSPDAVVDTRATPEGTPGSNE